MPTIFENYKLIIFDWEGTLAEFSHPVDKLLPETTELLNYLTANKILTAIATGKGKESLYNTLTAHDLVDRFACIASASEFLNKPDPAMLLHILEQLDIAATHALMVGDSLVDLMAAKAAGVDACLVNRTNLKHDLQPKFELTDLYLN